MSLPPESSGLSWADIVTRLGEHMATEGGEWCGVPMPVSGMTLEIEMRNPWRERLDKLQAFMDAEDGVARSAEAPETATIMNEWYSRTRRCKVIVVREADGRRWHAEYDHEAAMRGRFLIDTSRVTHIWPLAAELTAQARLRTLIAPHLWDGYMLTGMFPETSPRSRVSYIFRRGRPTLALGRAGARSDQLKHLAALCLHPIGYYAGTFAGSMVPTDDVIAHLLMMRGDEPLFWRRANQHPAYRPEAGL